MKKRIIGRERMNQEQFIEKMEQAFRTYFPFGHFVMKERQHILDHGRYLSLSIGLIQNVNDCSSRIRDNDPAHGIFSIEGFAIEDIKGHSLSCIPENSYYAMSHRKFGFRKAKKKSYEELLAYMANYFKKMRVFVDQNKDDIYHVADYDKRYINAPTKLEQVLK
jgi:hypothetical protein